MKERPILFSAPMVRAIQSGAKTQTRRVVKPGKWWVKDPDETDEYGRIIWAGEHWIDERLCPYGQPGDRLWVREAWCMKDGDGCWYRATDPEIYAAKVSGWKPSIHMPRWASRITLEIVSVRVERLNEISGPDAAAEGVQFRAIGAGVPLKGNIWKQNIDKFCALWESINGAGSWDANPWVWVVEFKVVPQ